MQHSARATNVSLTPAKEDLVLSDLWIIIRKRRVLLAGMAIGAGLLAAAYGVHKGKVYTAKGEIQIQPGAAAEFKQSLSSALGVGGGSLDVVIESDSRILTSDKLLTMVARTLKLQDDPRFIGGRSSIKAGFPGGKATSPAHGNLDDPYVRNAVLGNLRGHLTIARVPRTRMIAISYSSASPQLSADIVNTLESEFIKNNFITHYSNTEDVTKWLTGQIDDLRTIVQDSQDRMVDLQKKLGISALDPNHSMIVQEISNLEKGATDATQQRVLDEARYHILQSLPPDRIQDSGNTTGMIGSQGLLENLRSQRAIASAELARLQPVYGANYPQVKQLNAQIQALNREIAKEETAVINKAKDAYGIAHAAEQQAKGVLDTRVRELYGQRDDIVRYALLTEEYESNRHMYESILARLREAAVDSGLDSADISVVDLASLPIAPSSMSPVRMGEIGLLFGLLGGLAIALLLERMDTRMRDSKQIQDLLGMPVIAIVPQTNWKVKDSDPELNMGPEILWDARSAFAESIRVFRTSIQLSSTSRESRVIAITSCQPAEGKSTS